jgi:LAGLIDADG endonuclease
MLSTDAAWAAGFIDGEGTFTIHMTGSYYIARLGVPQNDIRPLVKLKNLYGGSISQVKSTGIYIYGLTGPGLDLLLETTLPYYTVKTEQAAIAQQFRKLPSGRTYGRKGMPPEAHEARRALRTQMIALDGRRTIYG